MSNMLCTRPSLAIGQRNVNRGFTAIELMVVVSILAVLTALAAPSFNPIIERWRVRSAAEEVVSAIQYARSEAIKRGGGITIDASAGWTQGWKITHTTGLGTTDLQTSTIPPKVSLEQSSGVNKLYVDRWGMVSQTMGGAPAIGSSILVHPYGKSTTDISAIRLCIVSGSKIEQVKQGAACPT